MVIMLGRIDIDRLRGATMRREISLLVPARLCRRSATGPSIGSLNIPVLTAFPIQVTTRGSPTFTETRLIK